MNRTLFLRMPSRVPRPAPLGLAGPMDPQGASDATTQTAFDALRGQILSYAARYSLQGIIPSAAGGPMTTTDLAAYVAVGNDIASRFGAQAGAFQAQALSAGGLPAGTAVPWIPSTVVDLASYSPLLANYVSAANSYTVSVPAPTPGASPAPVTPTTSTVTISAVPGSRPIWPWLVGGGIAVAAGIGVAIALASGKKHHGEPAMAGYEHDHKGDPAFDARIAYDAARTRGRSPKAAHGVAMKAAQKALRAAGESGSGWDQATAAQEAYGD